ncbi:MAG TPA: amino acid ABC transporter substrate-binding protein [Burkholderiales bacterium]|nr:amino acid ABC transporter substrate-binding protein [Burkholderiales bacterium]
MASPFVQPSRLARRVLAAACAGLLVLASAAHAASDTLAHVRTSGALHCGIPENLPGFAEKDEKGRYRGFSVDFCRAVAAATLGDPEKVRFTPVSSTGRFPLLLSGRIDLLAHTTTWTLTREAGIGVRFPGIYIHDGQGFLVPAAGAREMGDLKGSTICVEKGTTHVLNLEDDFARRGITYTPKVIESLPATTAAFFGGECQAYTSDRSTLAAVLATAPRGAGAWRILPGAISHEPLGPAVRRDDGEWETIVRWVLYALVAAEHRGLTRDNIRGKLVSGANPAARRMLEDGKTVARSLGLAPDWHIRAVEAGGNYGEVYERNLGAASPLKIERGANRLWTDGGLMYSPPFR